MRTDDLILNAIERIISVKLNKFENMDYKAIPFEKRIKEKRV